MHKDARYIYYVDLCSRHGLQVESNLFNPFIHWIELGYVIYNEMMLAIVINLIEKY